MDSTRLPAFLALPTLGESSPRGGDTFSATFGVALDSATKPVRASAFSTVGLSMVSVCVESTAPVTESIEMSDDLPLSASYLCSRYKSLMTCCEMRGLKYSGARSQFMVPYLSSTRQSEAFPPMVSTAFSSAYDSDTCTIGGSYVHPGRECTIETTRPVMRWISPLIFQPPSVS